jgi:DNA polymerase (family 10)
MPASDMTKRVEEALRNPFVRCLSHPKGRMIGRRPENALDLDRIYEVAREESVALEVNGLANRLDLHGGHVRDAIAAGIPIVCSTDSHSIGGLGNMELAVRTARRGWATAANILNSRPLEEILDRS